MPGCNVALSPERRRLPPISWLSPRSFPERPPNGGATAASCGTTSGGAEALSSPSQRRSSPQRTALSHWIFWPTLEQQLPTGHHSGGWDVGRVRGGQSGWSDRYLAGHGKAKGAASAPLALKCAAPGAPGMMPQPQPQGGVDCSGDAAQQELHLGAHTQYSSQSPAAVALQRCGVAFVSPEVVAAASIERRRTDARVAAAAAAVDAERPRVGGPPRLADLPDVKGLRPQSLPPLSKTYHFMFGSPSSFASSQSSPSARSRTKPETGDPGAELPALYQTAPCQVPWLSTGGAGSPRSYNRHVQHGSLLPDASTEQNVIPEAAGDLAEAHTEPIEPVPGVPSVEELRLEVQRERDAYIRQKEAALPTNCRRS
mmetsp:Transcript_15027/g.31336  ORF Transcript_15027/g.31336 Transcript_15027/m.31336 type:complete len:370 (-) Transcript_15027:32-1141(-)